MRKSTRKWMALFAVAAVLAAAGSAMAYGGRQHYGGPCRYGQGAGPGAGGAPNQGWHQSPRGPRMGGPRPHHEWSADTPQAIRDKQVEADKLRIDLRAELSKPQIDRARALDIWKKHRAIRDEIDEWFFTQRLEWAANRPNIAAPAAPNPTAPQ